MTHKSRGFEMKYEYEVFDSHAHPGFEKKDIEKRTGCLFFWFVDPSAATAEMGLVRQFRRLLGDKDPYKVITKPEEIPIDFSVGNWIESMDDAGVSHCMLQGLNTESGPFPDPTSGETFPPLITQKWHVPNEYIKKEFIDKYPNRFVAVGGVNPRAGIEKAVKQVEDAKKHGFLGIKFHTASAGYPNDKKVYPIYKRCLELDLHVEFHTGVEGIPGTREKYQDPIFIDDVAMDFPKLRIVVLHCGLYKNPTQAVWLVIKHPNVYTDITPAHPTWMQLKYMWDLEHLRFLEYMIPDKVFFGTDIPMGWPHRIYVDHIRHLPLSEGFKKKLLRDNARRFYLGE